MANKYISVVVPVLNAEEFIGPCIESLRQLDYPADRIEILVVDNGSTDRTVEIIADFSIAVLKETVAGAGAARNTGVARAHGDIIAFTDADCIVDRNWARAIDDAFGNPVTDAVMGFTKGLDENVWAELEQANFEAFWFDTDEIGRRLRRTGIDTRNAAIRKSVFEACGGFDPAIEYCEDLDLSIRIKRGGYRINFDERICVAHRNRTDLRHILELKGRHGYAYGKIVKKQPMGVQCPDLPVDIRKFMWINNGIAQSRRLLASRLLMTCLEYTVIAALRCLILLRLPSRGLPIRLFKTACALRWELRLLRALREKT